MKTSEQADIQSDGSVELVHVEVEAFVLHDGTLDRVHVLGQETNDAVLKAAVAQCLYQKRMARMIASSQRKGG